MHIYSHTRTSQVAHVQADHAAERVSLQRFPSVLRWCYGLIALCGLAPTDSLVLLAEGWRGLDLGSRLLLTLPYSRLHEEEADLIGLATLVGACVHPARAVETWERLAGAGEGEVEAVDAGPRPACSGWLRSDCRPHSACSIRTTPIENIPRNKKHPATHIFRLALLFAICF